VNVFLFLAFSFVWLIFVVYAWSLSRRQERLHAELEKLERKLQSGDRTGP
jgi:CcmD family protein